MVHIRPTKRSATIGIILVIALVVSTDAPVRPTWGGPSLAVASPAAKGTIWAAITQLLELHHAIRLRLNTGTLPLTGVFRLLAPFLPPGYREWEWGGVATVTGTIERNDDSSDSGGTVQLLVKVHEASFVSPDRTSLGNHISGHLSLVLRGDRQRHEVAFEANLDLREGELLIDQFYGNLARTPLHLDLKGAYELTPDILIIDRLSLGVPTVGSIVVAGTVASPWVAPTFFLPHSQVTVSHESAFAHLIKDPFQSHYPALGHVSCTGETIVTARIAGDPTRFTVEGRLTMDETTVRLQHGASIDGLRADLPFIFRFPVSGETAPAGETISLPLGLISMQEVKARGLVFGPLAVSVQPIMNGLTTAQPLVIPLFNGLIEIPHLHVRGIGGPDPVADFSIYISDIDLLALSREYFQFAVAGTLEGLFPSITLHKGTLTTEGSVTAQVFGGEVVLSNIHGERTLSRLRRIIMDARLLDIDLEKATSAIPFGKVTGFVDGSIDGLAFSFGQPEQFELRVESVPDRRVRRIFEARAVENLIILGSGSPTAVFQKGISSLFKTFPYSRLGIHCTLDNDLFTLRGTIHEGGVEYLVRKSLFRGIDVINKNPRNTIRWGDMMARLQRIFAEEGGSPQITTR